jgi:outer membrane protein assembly factor BamE (lipoprotein component of BamABCDE complex)
MISEKKSIFIIIIFLITFMTSCQPRISQHGNFINYDNLHLIKKTKLNKSEVIEIFGEPTTKSTFSDSVWYYITLTQHEKAYYEIKNIENKVLVITFDKNQYVKKFKLLSEEDTTEIDISYPNGVSSSDEDLSIIQEFFSILSRKLDTRTK